MNLRISVAHRVVAVLCTATSALLPLCSAWPNDDVRSDGPPRAVVRSDDVSGRCPLSRVHAQYVRCDDLTGNGVPAPSRVPVR